MILTDDFSLITPTTPLGSASGYGAVVGTGMSFVTGSRQAIELKVTTGENFGRVTTRPEFLHQSIGIKVQFGAGLGSTAYTGVFGRYIDVDNYVLARIDHNARQAELIENVAGTPTTLISLALTAGVGEIGAGLKLELVGQRARLFFEPHFRDVPDQPPDAAATLTGVYTAAGEWGMYMNSNDGGNSMRIENVTTQPIASAVMPAPSLLVEDADALRFHPITASVAGAEADDVEFQWEVYPAEADDFAEAYRDTTPVTSTARVFWVRSGRSYYVRVRAISVAGEAGDWVLEGPLTAGGTKTSPPAVTLPDDIFPDILPSYVLRWSPTDSQIGAVISEVGKPKLMSGYFRPRSNLTMKFDNRTKAELEPLRTFHHRMRGIKTPFQWTHPVSGHVLAVRFSKDDLDFTPLDQVVEDTDVVATFEMPITEIVTDGVSVLTFSIEMDPALY